MQLPFKGLYIFTQDFGANPGDYAKFGILGHNGLDFACPTRTEILAPHDGKVIEASFDQTGYGNYVKIENDTEGSVIAHLDSIDVQVGFMLRQNDHIGWSDNTGNSTGPHCHWGYYLFPRDRANGYAGFIDQKPYLEKAGIHLTLGQLPVVDSPVTNGEVAGEYKGLDLANSDSVKAAIDAWYDVANGKYKTAEEYQTLETQFETVKEQLTQLQTDSEKLSPEINSYHSMQAVGYNTLDDITNALKGKDQTITKLQQDQIVLEKKNEKLAGLIQEDSQNNYQGMEEGLRTLDRVKQLEGYVLEIQKAAGVNQKGTRNVISKVLELKDLADRFMSRIEQEHNQKLRMQVIKNVKAAKDQGIDYISQLFNLIPKKKEVN